MLLTSSSQYVHQRACTKNASCYSGGTRTQDLLLSSVDVLTTRPSNLPAAVGWFECVEQWVLRTIFPKMFFLRQGEEKHLWKYGQRCPAVNVRIQGGMYNDVICMFCHTEQPRGGRRLSSSRTCYAYTSADRSCDAGPKEDECVCITDGPPRGLQIGYGRRGDAGPPDDEIEDFCRSIG